MPNKTVLLFAAAVLVAAMTALAVRSRLEPPPEQAVVVPRILVAKHDLPAGSFLNPQADFDWAAWPTETIREYHLREGAMNPLDYQGAVMRRAMKAGEPLTDGIMVKRGSGGFMPAVLEPGKRAVSIAVSATTGNAGFVSPGDFVDLILTHRVRVDEGGPNAGVDSVVSETFVENVRVIAVDQMLDNPENKAILAKTVTVEVTPRQAEKVSVAQDLGKISLSLRSLAADNAASSAATAEAAAAGEVKIQEPASDAAAVQPVIDPFFMEPMPAPPVEKDVTSDRDLSKALSGRSEVSPRVRVIRGDAVENLRFYREQP